jgi:hypothetical protein
MDEWTDTFSQFLLSVLPNMNQLIDPYIAIEFYFFILVMAALIHSIFGDCGKNTTFIGIDHNLLVWCLPQGMYIHTNIAQAVVFRLNTFQPHFFNSIPTYKTFQIAAFGRTSNDTSAEC